MRKRMKQLARGKFECTKPQLQISETEISFQVMEGEEYEGSFTIECVDGKPIRGLVYSTNPRMECLTPQFEGENIRIRYQFHSYGLSEGLTETGDFVIICEQNEISLSFCASILKKYADTSIGIVKNLYDFSLLAKSNWSEAFQLFYHRDFANLIKENEVKEGMIYRGIVGARPSNQNMEEFLIGIRKKEKVNFSVSETSFEFYEVKENRKESFEIQKDHWGYLEINASCEESFVRIEKKRIRTEDFIGSTYGFEFLIDAGKLHPGKNYARILLTGVYETRTIEIMACREEKRQKDKLPVLQEKECLAGIMELYQAYRLKRIVTGVWANETIEILDHLKNINPNEPMYRLMKAQCYIVNHQRQEAEWILERFRRDWEEKKSPIWAYYLYLQTLLEREPVYVDRMTREIEGIFHENPDSVLCFWILTFLKEEYFNNSSLKFRSIGYWVMKGCSSPYLYLEAYYLIWQDPYLLMKLDEFEIRILRWASKTKALTKDIVAQIFRIAKNEKQWKPVIYGILCDAYEADPREEYVEILCQYLIKSQQYDQKYHSWYVRGIELELHITGLYEAYLMSMDERKIAPVPKIVQMYFQYDSGLPYRKMAVLYNNIIAAKTTEPEMYRKYLKVMSRFAMEQIIAGRMDDNLAVIYDDMLELGVINAEIAKGLSKIVFTHKVVVFDERIVRAIVYQRQMKEAQVVPVVGNTAYFQLFSKEYVILFEDEKGQRYTASIPHRLQGLMDPNKYLEKCMRLAPQELSYLLAYFEKKQSYLAFSEEDKEKFGLLMFSDAISHEYKAKLLPEILRFYQTHAYDGMMKEYLGKADYSRLSDATRRLAMELLVENHMYDLAYEKIARYGMDYLGAGAQASLAEEMILRVDGEEDEFLLRLSMEAFRKDKYNRTILSYLCQYYSGPTEEMLRLWKTAAEYEIERFDLSERLLVQGLYAANLVYETLPVFRYYYESDGKDFVTLAYISQCAHAYFVDGEFIDSDVIELIEAKYIYEHELNDACRLALLKYYTAEPALTPKQERIEEELVKEFTRKNLYFAFYKQLPEELQMKYHLYDKIFLEYRANPHSHVMIHYSRDEDGENFLREDMVDMYDGIFVKAFVMFFGEALQYYISEEYHNETQVTESCRIVNNDTYGRNDVSRYNLLNQMLISHTLMEHEELYRTMKAYEGFEEVTHKVFDLL